MHIVGLRCIFWLDPAQRGESSKSLVARALFGIYLGKCWDKSAHHILVPAKLSPTGVAYVTTSAFCRPDYANPPCGEAGIPHDGWQFVSEATRASPDGGVSIPSPYAAGPEIPTDSAFVDEVLIHTDATNDDDEDRESAPTFRPAPLVADDAVHDGEMMPISEDDTTTPLCETNGCRLPKDHPGPCQSYLPENSGPLDGVPSARVRSLRPQIMTLPSLKIAEKQVA